ncbi:MAG: hypothetical protein ACK5RJ_03330 [Burkholderiales bacterium]|jgi:hypothetical protein|nr:hypothetical protein [Rhodocyclaceae bacterium]MCA3021302.1 hypothetical protein [Rhodocyclaceae bacterium]MCA3054375.1 hypothetical protein [Rhodocyclaceae bacterium]
MIKTKQQLLDAVPVQTMEGGTRYVRINDIPEPWRAQAQNEIRGCACPVVEGQGPLYYVRDFEDWVGGRWWGMSGPKGLK